MNICEIRNVWRFAEVSVAINRKCITRKHCPLEISSLKINHELGTRTCGESRSLNDTWTKFGEEVSRGSFARKFGEEVWQWSLVPKDSCIRLYDSSKLLEVDERQIHKETGQTRANNKVKETMLQPGRQTYARRMRSWTSAAANTNCSL